jgi:hypothetical protein
MNLQPRIIEIYDWDDVMVFLCEKMQIELKYFRDYHLLVGGGYKDFWHVYVDVLYNDVDNDRISHLWFDMFEMRRQDMIENYGDYVNLLFDAVKELEKTTGKEYISIEYSW